MNNEVVLEQDDSIRSRAKDDVRSKQKGKESAMNDDVFFSKVEKIRQKMYAIAYSYFYSESTACDLVDDAIYRGFLKKKTLKNEDFFETWMIRILLNLCAT